MANTSMRIMALERKVDSMSQHIESISHQNQEMRHAVTVLTLALEERGVITRAMLRQTMDAMTVENITTTLERLKAEGVKPQALLRFLAQHKIDPRNFKDVLEG